MIPVIVKLCESPSKAGGLLMINYPLKLEVRCWMLDAHIVFWQCCVPIYSIGKCVKDLLCHPHAFLVSSFQQFNDRTNSFPSHGVCPFHGGFNSI